MAFIINDNQFLIGVLGDRKVQVNQHSVVLDQCIYTIVDDILFVHDNNSTTQLFKINKNQFVSLEVKNKYLVLVYIDCYIVLYNDKFIQIKTKLFHIQDTKSIKDYTVYENGFSVIHNKKSIYLSYGSKVLHESDLSFDPIGYFEGYIIGFNGLDLVCNDGLIKKNVISYCSLFKMNEYTLCVFNDKICKIVGEASPNKLYKPIRTICNQHVFQGKCGKYFIVSDECIIDL